LKISAEYFGIALKLALVAQIWLITIIPAVLAVLLFVPLVIIDTLRGRRFWESGSYWERTGSKMWNWYFKTKYASKLEKLSDTFNDLDRAWVANSWKSFIKIIFNTLNLDENYTTSYSLHWLIQQCETPSSVTIALQAIAGATRKIPNRPLELCDSSMKILQRLVSSTSGPTAAQDASLYARALKFLVPRSESYTEPSDGKSNEEVAVMIWDLKVQHERLVSVFLLYMGRVTKQAKYFLNATAT
jgi:hypothetical protein